MEYSVRFDEIKWLLVDQIYDLPIAREVFLDYRESLDFDVQSKKHAAIIRMCTSYTILNLAKLWEILDEYGNEVNSLPEPLRKNCINLKKKLVELKVFQFRSKYIAHVFDHDIKPKKPLALESAQKRLNDIVGENMSELADFFNWVCPSKNKELSGSVVGVVSDLRDYCNTIDSSDVRL
ncbi:MAG: hypothetical protein ACJAXJ_003268 [Colwellia sp.]